MKHKIPEFQVYTTLDTLSSKTKVNKSLIAKFDIILQHGIKSTNVNQINIKKRNLPV